MRNSSSTIEQTHVQALLRELTLTLRAVVAPPAARGAITALISSLTVCLLLLFC
jgi:hypothetical protein